MLTEPHKNFVKEVWGFADGGHDLEATLEEATSLLRHLKKRVADVERVNRNLQGAKEAERCFRYLKKFLGGGM
ncbi:hypothetical protein [Neptuniibacter sp.]|uniref:hypothetical protein n=1 Tax=Neptuniibacter sp. TaxID=1962643 RepID=UPI002601C2E5|nr:hypothetical protein [Neptuniibacter sp.]MCP4596221.1 hypothetical protein [Neptuniibacter sp.]